MARGRMLMRVISESEKVQKLMNDTCRLLYTWLIPFCDKNGCFHATPQLVKSKIFPWREDVSVKQIKKYLDDMEKMGLLRFYHDGKYLQLINFKEKQPNLREDREITDFPEPPDDSPTHTTPDQLRSNSRATPDPIRHQSGKMPADRGNFPVNVPPKISKEKLSKDKGSDKKDVDTQMTTKCQPLTNTITNTNTNQGEKDFSPTVSNVGTEKTKYSTEFLEFWREYPRKVGKGHALKAWNKLKFNDTFTLQTILSAIQIQRNQESWKKDNGKYIPHPATWLNGERWEDEVQPSITIGKTSTVPLGGKAKELWEKRIRMKKNETG